jgi:DNA-binding GntR family transcriptional regulator
MSQRPLNLKTLPLVPSLKDMALLSIREAILSKKLEPGITYAEAALSGELGISRTPVREALIHLASRGLILYIPRKGFRIISLTEKDVENIFELRLALELTVIRRITPGLTDKSLHEIEELGFIHKTKAEKSNPAESLDADRQLHLFLAHLTDNPYLMKSIEEIRDFVDLASLRSLELEFRTAEAIKEHQGIIHMLKVRSVDGAVQKMEQHILVTKQSILSRLQVAGQ